MTVINPGGGGGGGAPSGAAGGDLSGTYPNPGVAKATAGLEVPATANEALELAQVAANIVLANFLLAADASPSFEITGDGKIQWGAGGATAPDTNLYRLSAGILKTDQTIFAGGGVTASGGSNVVASGYLNAQGGPCYIDNGDCQVRTAGKGVQIKEGANARMGTATLVAGAVTVANTSVTASTRIFLLSNADGGTPGFLRVSARVAGTSFTITSSNGADTSTVAYLLIEPN